VFMEAFEKNSIDLHTSTPQVPPFCDSKSFLQGL
jgi:hypothetical protein